ncbi:hypothetical protein HJC23_001798 [Cyclotella cryptica]|uniref:Uncharacterized protein n=1 Tax=Cyclotella cryptica TaxID=29204 RepID=A0ABD3PJ87_9STRA|eukprot:CCRYP_014495-RA/>CCRYP_014495-RA protein AED:0.19 eAED:0.19 QI:144/1/1/1/0/0/3/173/365
MNVINRAITSGKKNEREKLWTEDNVLLGKLLLAVADMQSFVCANWTSAQARHQSLPASGMHFCRAQIRHSSMLAVHSRPVPNESSDIDVDIFMRRKKLSEAWELMKSVDGDLWTDVCHLYSKVMAVDQNPSMFTEDQSILEEVAEAKVLMRNAETLAAVETIESFRQEEWSNVNASTAIRHGSELTVHNQHHDESTIENKVRHAEHANAWQKMHSCDKAEWAAACLYHEEVVKAMAAKEERLDAAVWVIQDFNAKNWTSAHLIAEEDPCWKACQIRHGSTLAVHENAFPGNDDPVYHAHRERMIDAWKVMKAVGSSAWTKACRSHEDLLVSATRAKTYKVGDPTIRMGVVRNHPPLKNSVNGKAA